MDSECIKEAGGADISSQAGCLESCARAIPLDQTVMPADTNIKPLAEVKTPLDTLVFIDSILSKYHEFKKQEFADACIATFNNRNGDTKVHQKTLQEAAQVKGALAMVLVLSETIERIRKDLTQTENPLTS